MDRNVAIVGAGVSGLLACKYILSKGYSPVVFEAKSNIGGVWMTTFETTKLQTPRSYYQFSDFPWPESVTSDYPSNQEVRAYLESYAVHFDLFKHIKFNHKVMSLKYEGALDAEIQTWSLWGGTGEPFSAKGKWNLTVQDTQNLSTQDLQFDFVVLCNGEFSDIPNIPKFPQGKGPEVFKGKVMHSMEYSSMDNATAADFVKGKRIVIVGNGKSAVDLAVECSTRNGAGNPCTMIYRNEQWSVDNNLPLLSYLPYIVSSRFGELLINKPEEGFLSRLIATILSPLRWGAYKFLEIYLSKKLNLAKHGTLPKHSVLKQTNACALYVLPDDFYDKLDEKSIKLVKTQNFTFCEKGILVDGQVEPLETDLVILCTGYRGVEKVKNIFVSPFFHNCMGGSNHRRLPLYRKMIQPRIPQLAVVGFLDSASSLHTSEMMSKWLAELLDGKFKVPSIKNMEKSIEEWDKFMKQYTYESYKGSCAVSVHIWYNDQLCKDMGWNPKRKKGFFSELFEPYGPLDYAHS